MRIHIVSKSPSCLAIRVREYQGPEISNIKQISIDDMRPEGLLQGTLRFENGKTLGFEIDEFDIVATTFTD